MFQKKTKLYHLTSKKVYDTHIQHEGLVPHPISHDYNPGVGLPTNAIFCWPDYTEDMLRDWIVFNKLKNKNEVDDYVLLEVSVPKEAILDNGVDYNHSLGVVVDGSHGTTKYNPHKNIPMCLVTETIPPESVVPILGINTFTAEEI